MINYLNPKKMKYLFVILSFLSLVSFSNPSKSAESDFKKILGSWEFSAPNAPQPYNQGTLVLKDVEQKLTGAFSVEGQVVTIPKIAFTNDSLIMDFEVENTPISLKMVLKDGKLQGSTDTPNGIVTVTAKQSAGGAK
jgi:hypothetical protein